MSLLGWLTGADKAAKATNKAYKRADALAREGLAKTDSLLTPGSNYQPAQTKMFDLLGLNGTQNQANAYGAYQESPELAFQREQGQEGVLRAASAGGHLGGTRTQKNLAQFNQGVASQGFGDFYSRLRDLYESTKGTAGQLAGYHTNAGSRLGDLALGRGQAQAQSATANSPWSLISGIAGIGADALGSYLGKPKTSFSGTSIYGIK